MPDISLLDMCIAKTALLLKECYWPVGSYTSECSEEYNPFAALPSHINEELISAVIQLTPSGTLSVRQLYLILSSGRIKNFKLEDVLLPTEEFVGILTALSVHGRQLNKLILQKIYCLETGDEKYQSMKSTAIECLLMMSPNLEHIEIDKEFDIKAIQHIRFLKHLELNFFPQNKLFDLIPKIDDYLFIPNETISYISIFEDYHNLIPLEELAFLLQNCTELTCIQNNIAGALELLHGEELFCGSLTKQYKLRKYILGSAFLNPIEGTASVTVIQIATVTCPQTRELDVLVNNHQAIAALADFKHLESFLIQWERATAGDFRLGLQSVLQIIGTQLKDLSILNFNNIDFEIIGKFCPFLLELKVEYDNEVGIASTDHAYFTCLTGLHVQCEGFSGMKPDTLLLLLGSCRELTSLCLDNARCLTDELLTVLLKMNCLPKLKEVSLSYCSLTERGLRFLIKSCPSLEFLCFYSSRLTFDEAVQIVHSMNPFIIVSTKV